MTFTEEPSAAGGEPRWTWRNCRSIGFSVHFWPLNWRFGFERDVDVYGGDWRLSLGPLLVVMSANIGNCSSENRFEAWVGLSEYEAYERANSQPLHGERKQ